MFARKFAVGSAGIIVAIAGAVAIARSSGEANVSSFKKNPPQAQPQAAPPVARCPHFDWPYGCAWRPASGSGSKHSSTRKNKRDRRDMSFFGYIRL
jgi:hypothetical protein